MLRHQRAQLPLYAAFIIIVVLFAGYTLQDQNSVQLKNHVLNIDKLQDEDDSWSGRSGEQSGGRTSKASTRFDMDDEKTPSAKIDPLPAKGDPARDAQRAPDTEKASDTTASSITELHLTSEKDATPDRDPNTVSLIKPEMGYKDAKPKKSKNPPPKEEEPVKPGWRKTGTKPAVNSIADAKPKAKNPPKQKPPPIIEDSASYRESRPSVDYDKFSQTVVKDTSGYELTEAKNSVSYDKTTPPSVGCEDVVTELQNLVIEVYSEELKDIRHAHIFGLLDATENKGDAVIWVAQEILLSTLGITTMQACRYIDQDCDVDAWRAGLTEYAPYSGIIMAGGGNFNDYFEDDHPARLKMVNEYGDRWPIRMFPQSINMTTAKWTQQTLEAFGNAKDAQLAARDLPSYEWLDRAFGRDESSGAKVGDVRLSLSPDVAFMFGNRPDIRRNTEKTHDIYILARDDSEVAEGESKDVPLGPGVFDFGPEAGDVTYLKNDWRHVPTPMDGRRGPRERNWAKAMHGFEILASAEFLITDRLHGHIMATLMGIPHVLMDSKLKKNLFYHDTWTKDCDCVRVASNIEEAVEIAQMYFEKQTKDGKRKKKIIDAPPTE